MDRADNDSDHRCLDAQECGSEERSLDREPRVRPGKHKHEHEARQHKAEPCQKAAQPSFGADSEMNAEFMRFRARQHLHDREELVEPVAFYPTLLVNQLAPDHRDLRHGSAERHHAEA
jgi:hypothetical protein